MFQLDKVRPAQLQATKAVFDAALKHVREQRCQSITMVYDAEIDEEKPSCRYRGPNGTQCAFAPAIKDYLPEMENMPADLLLNKYYECLHDWAKNCNSTVAVRIQRAHDNWFDGEGVPFMEYFERNMKKVAEIFGLDYTPEA
jgi:hypothetical protein